MPAKRSLDWLTEASRKWRAATSPQAIGNVGYQSQTPGTVAPPPSSSVLKNLGGPQVSVRSSTPSGGYLTPEFWQTLQQIIEYRKQNPPVYAPFPAGTPTLARQEYETSKEQWERDFAEKKRQFEKGYALDALKTRLQAQQASQPKLTSEDIRNANLAGLIDYSRSYLQKHIGDEATSEETMLAIHDLEKDLLKRYSDLVSKGVSDKDLQTALSDAFTFAGVNPADYVSWKQQTQRSTGLVERILAQTLEDALLQKQASSFVGRPLGEQQ